MTAPAEECAPHRIRTLEVLCSAPLLAARLRVPAEAIWQGVVEGWLPSVVSRGHRLFNLAEAAAALGQRGFVTKVGLR